jgi:hypothetical protein
VVQKVQPFLAPIWKVHSSMWTRKALIQPHTSEIWTKWVDVHSSLSLQQWLCDTGISTHIMYWVSEKGVKYKENSRTKKYWSQSRNDLTVRWFDRAFYVEGLFSENHAGEETQRGKDGRAGEATQMTV